MEKPDYALHPLSSDSPFQTDYINLTSAYTLGIHINIHLAQFITSAQNRIKVSAFKSDSQWPFRHLPRDPAVSRVATCRCHLSGTNTTSWGNQNRWRVRGSKNDLTNRFPPNARQRSDIKRSDFHSLLLYGDFKLN